MPFGFIALGILPSAVWLSIYLKEDDRPEPNKFILKTFFLGALMAPVAAGIEFLLVSSVRDVTWPIYVINFVMFFGFIGLVEEYCKYLAVKLGALKNTVFDEPTDAMIYLIVSGLGFAALENILALFHFVGSDMGFLTGEAFEITILRFLSSTLLHVLASAIVGYHLARQHFFGQKFSLIKGILIAGILHGTDNTLTVVSNSFQKIGPTIVVMFLFAVMAIWVNLLFYKLKKDFFR